MKFINAYNFVPLGKGVIRSPLPVGRLTGRISCTLTPKTDLFIPNTSTDKLGCSGVHGDILREFYSHEQLNEKENISTRTAPEKPVIPGSELRGMVRSMYETLTDSCLSALNITPLSVRTQTPFEPGILEYKDGNWSMYKAEKLKIGVQIHTDDNGHYINVDGKQIRNFGKIYYNGIHTESEYIRGVEIRTVYADDISLNSGKYSGYLIIGEKMRNENTCFLFAAMEKNEKSDKININNNDVFLKAVMRYNTALTDYYRNAKINKTAGTAHIGRDIPEEPANGTVIPVWYKIIAKKLYLKAAQLGREVFYNTIENIVGNYVSCESYRDEDSGYDILHGCYCETCALFGTIGEQNSIGSRLRFSDARFSGGKAEYSPVTTLKELSGSKKTTLEFYTKLSDPDVRYWTYDYYKKADGSVYSFVSKCTENDPVRIEIAGRKFYYHHPNCKDNSYYKYQEQINMSPNGNSKRLVTVRPLKGIESNKFSFDVYFEKITVDELKKLICTLSLFGNSNDNCYKLGMGKPIGLGSVKITVDDVYIRRINIGSSISYNDIPLDSYAGNDNILKEIKDILARIKAKETDDKLWDMFDITEESAKMIKTQLDLNYAAGREVSYPYVIKDGNKTVDFTWFSKNRITGNNAGYNQRLGDSGELELYTIPPRNDHRNYNNRSNGRRR